jgi:nucleoside-diphosphate-sugar epimerase
MRILVTGGTGYLGSHIVRRLLQDGHDVTVLRRWTSRLHRLADIEMSVRFENAEDDFGRIMLRTAPDVLLHAATCFGRPSEVPLHILQTNVALPLQLLEAAKAVGVPMFVNTDTSLPPELNLYALSKQQFTQWAKALVDEGGIRVLNVRIESVYGPEDQDTRFPTALVRALIRNDPTFPMTFGEQMRDFIYVEDAADACVRLLSQAQTEQSAPWKDVGVGTGQPISIRQFAETAKQLAASDTQLLFGAYPYRKHELMTSRADVSALTALGWSQSRDLRSGLQRTITKERMLT